MGNDNLTAFLSGLLPPFSIRDSKASELKICERIIESECALFTILNFSDNLKKGKVKILAVVYDDHFNFTMKMELGIPVVMFGCFENIQIFIYPVDSNKNFIYSFKLNCCRNWGIKNVKAINLLDTQNFEEVSVKIDNAKPQSDYHYNIVERPMLPVLFKSSSE